MRETVKAILLRLKFLSENELTQLLNIIPSDQPEQKTQFKNLVNSTDETTPADNIDSNISDLIIKNGRLFSSILHSLFLQKRLDLAFLKILYQDNQADLLQQLYHAYKKDPLFARLYFQDLRLTDVLGLKNLKDLHQEFQCTSPADKNDIPEYLVIYSCFYGLELGDVKYSERHEVALKEYIKAQSANEINLEYFWNWYKNFRPSITKMAESDEKFNLTIKTLINKIADMPLDPKADHYTLALEVKCLYRFTAENYKKLKQDTTSFNHIKERSPFLFALFEQMDFKKYAGMTHEVLAFRLRIGASVDDFYEGVLSFGKSFLDETIFRSLIAIESSDTQDLKLKKFQIKLLKNQLSREDIKNACGDTQIQYEISQFLKRMLEEDNFARQYKRDLEFYNVVNLIEVAEDHIGFLNMEDPKQFVEVFLELPRNYLLLLINSPDFSEKFVGFLKNAISYQENQLGHNFAIEREKFNRKIVKVIELLEEVESRGYLNGMFLLWSNSEAEEKADWFKLLTYWPRMFSILYKKLDYSEKINLKKFCGCSTEIELLNKYSKNFRSRIVSLQNMIDEIGYKKSVKKLSEGKTPAELEPEVNTRLTKQVLQANQASCSVDNILHRSRKNLNQLYARLGRLAEHEERLLNIFFEGTVYLNHVTDFLQDIQDKSDHYLLSVEERRRRNVSSISHTPKATGNSESIFFSFQWAPKNQKSEIGSSNLANHTQHTNIISINLTALLINHPEIAHKLWSSEVFFCYHLSQTMPPLKIGDSWVQTQYRDSDKLFVDYHHPDHTVINEKFTRGDETCHGHHVITFRFLRIIEQIRKLDKKTQDDIYGKLNDLVFLEKLVSVLTRVRGFEIYIIGVQNILLNEVKIISRANNQISQEKTNSIVTKKIITKITEWKELTIDDFENEEISQYNHPFSQPPPEFKIMSFPTVSKGITPKYLIHFAAYYGSARQLEFLIKAGLDVSVMDSSTNTTILHFASYSYYQSEGKIAFILKHQNQKNIISAIDINLYVDFECGISALYLATHWRDLGSVKLLLENGADQRQQSVRRALILHKDNMKETDIDISLYLVLFSYYQFERDDRPLKDYLSYRDHYFKCLNIMRKWAPCLINPFHSRNFIYSLIKHGQPEHFENLILVLISLLDALKKTRENKNVICLIDSIMELETNNYFEKLRNTSLTLEDNFYEKWIEVLTNTFIDKKNHKNLDENHIMIFLNLIKNREKYKDINLFPILKYSASTRKHILEDEILVSRMVKNKNLDHEGFLSEYCMHYFGVNDYKDHYGFWRKILFSKDATTFPKLRKYALKICPIDTFLKTLRSLTSGEYRTLFSKFSFYAQALFEKRPKCLEWLVIKGIGTISLAEISKTVILTLTRTESERSIFDWIINGEDFAEHLSLKELLLKNLFSKLIESTKNLPKNFNTDKLMLLHELFLEQNSIIQYDIIDLLKHYSGRINDWSCEYSKKAIQKLLGEEKHFSKILDYLKEKPEEFSNLSVFIIDCVMDLINTGKQNDSKTNFLLVYAKLASERRDSNPRVIEIAKKVIEKKAYDHFNVNLPLDITRCENGLIQWDLIQTLGNDAALKEELNLEWKTNDSTLIKEYNDQLTKAKNISTEQAKIALAQQAFFNTLKLRLGNALVSKEKENDNDSKLDPNDIKIWLSSWLTKKMTDTDKACVSLVCRANYPFYQEAKSIKSVDTQLTQSYYIYKRAKGKSVAQAKFKVNPTLSNWFLQQSVVTCFLLSTIIAAPFVLLCAYDAIKKAKSSKTKFIGDEKNKAKANDSINRLFSTDTSNKNPIMDQIENRYISLTKKINTNS